MSNKIYDSLYVQRHFPTNSDFDDCNPLNVPYPLMYNCWFEGKGICIVESSRCFYIRVFRWVPTWSPEPLTSYDVYNWHTVYKSKDFYQVQQFYIEFCKELLGIKSKRSV